MFDQKKLENDEASESFIISDEDFDILLQPLRLVVISLKDLDPRWAILNDRFRRNTMIIASDEDVRKNKEINRFLELQGVALLMCKRQADGFLCLESLLKSLSSLKFKSILVEDRIDLIKEFTRLD